MTATDTAPLLEGLQVRPGLSAPWLDRVRADARRAFDAEGLPGRRTEAWKYTRLKRLVETAFLPRAAAATAPPTSLTGLDAHTVVLVNGRLVPDLSDLDGLPDGVFLSSLAQAVENDPGRVEPWLGAGLSPSGMPLAALNTAGFEDGAVLQVANGFKINRPIHLVFWTDGSVDPAVGSPRMIYTVGSDASVDVVESHGGVGQYLVNAVGEAFVGAGGRLGHYKRQDESAEGSHIAATAATVAAGGQYDSFVLQTGAGLARNEIRVLLEGETAGCRLNGAYAGLAEQHLDNTTFIDHAVPRCTSREVYKGVLADAARGVFQGKILVRRDAQQTDGHQLNRALLLSRGAEVDSKPELEIYADDVKCSHGATAGELDPAQLFYLRARGIGEAAARRILIEAFLMEVLDEIGDEAIRAAFAGTLGRKLAAVAAATGEGVWV